MVVGPESRTCPGAALPRTCRVAGSTPSAWCLRRDDLGGSVWRIPAYGRAPRGRAMTPGAPRTGSARAGMSRA